MLRFAPGLSAAVALLAPFGLAVLLNAAAAAPAHADEIADVIDEARDLYAEGDVAGARDSLQYALDLIRQQGADNLSAALPEAPEGWTAGEIETTAGAAALLGGGTTAQRAYENGGQSVTVRIIADSPMLAQLAAVMSNSAIAQASGRKIARVNRTRAMVGEGELQMMYANRFLVQISGAGQSDDALIGWAKTVRFDALDVLP